MSLDELDCAMATAERAAIMAVNFILVMLWIRLGALIDCALIVVRCLLLSMTSNECTHNK